LPPWSFEPQTRRRPSGENLAEPNFSREDRDLENIFLRELTQNVLDARVDDSSRVDGKVAATLKISVLRASDGLDVAFLKALLNPIEPHLVAAGHPSHQRDYSKAAVLVAEEFGTLGLTGTTTDSYAEGPEERWANFWVGEGKRSKGGRSLGRKGQGKIVYHVISGARTVLAITRRAGESGEYMFGKAIVQKTHKVRSEHFTQHGYWADIDAANADQPIPCADPIEIGKVKSAFGLTRTGEQGTSWIIPFVPEKFNKESLVREFLRDFYFSVLRGALVAEICGVRIDQSTVGALLLAARLDRPTPKFFEFMTEAVTRPETELVKVSAGWAAGAIPPESCIAAEELTQIKSDLADGKIVSLRLPIEIKLLGGTSAPSWIDLHLKSQDQPTEELYVRSGLNISEERHLNQVSRSAFGLVLAEHEAISDFLGCCEEASHLKWNNQEKGAKERFEKIRDTLSSVRHSLPRFFKMLAGSSDKEVKDALVDVLSFPQPGGKKVKAERTPKKGKADPKPKKLMIKRVFPEVISVSSKMGTWRLKPGKHAALQAYPLTITMKFAYDRLDGLGNPWLRYHIYDFDLGDTSAFNVPILQNATVVQRQRNEIEIEVLSDEFLIEITGFSTSIPLLSRATLAGVAPLVMPPVVTAPEPSPEESVPSIDVQIEAASAAAPISVSAAVSAAPEVSG
jgi:hypothetical protein